MRFDAPPRHSGQQGQATVDDVQRTPDDQPPGPACSRRGSLDAVWWYTGLAVIGWTLVIVVLLAWNLAQLRATSHQMAVQTAESSYRKDLLYRRWAAGHGGVYAPVTAETPPNPYLAHVPERDITTPSGRPLTLINPAYMTRQVHELGAQSYGHQGHITSLKVLRPGNEPDAWETEALRAFEAGAAEAVGVETIGGEPHLRFMRPLIAEQNCLRCHARQGYQLGDIRGGISVTVPLAPYLKELHHDQANLAVSYGAVWGLGLATMLASARHIRRRVASQRRSEQALLRSETKFRTLYDSTSDAVMLLDSRGFFDCNEAALRMFGCATREELCSRHPADLSPEQQPCGTDSSVFTRHWMETAMQAGSSRFEWVHRRADTGACFAAEVLLNAMELDGRRILQSVVRDITERRQAEEELRGAVRALEHTNARLEEVTVRANDMAVRAEAANCAKSEFLANMSHEIRTPMTAILGYADFIAEGCPGRCEYGSGEMREAIQIIRQSGRHLLALIDGILDLSKVEADKMTIEQVACSPHQLVAEVASLVCVRASEKGLQFMTEFIGAIPETICTDPLRLRQILVNVMGNAIKFTERGGVRLLARFIDDGGESRMQFDAIDTGIGMTAEQAQRLFQPFSQADASTTRQFGGTGLGLAISRRLARLLGGDLVLVESEPGLGTRFRITVATGPVDGVGMVEDAANQERLTARSGTACEASASSTLHPLEGLSLLLAEDGPDNQRLIAHVLRKSGAEVEVVDNGALAMEVVLAAVRRGEPFDVILMDMQMPVMDGYEATANLRERGYAAPIIALTAHAMAGDRQACRDAGCDDYAAKPIDRTALIETILRHAGGRPPATVELSHHGRGSCEPAPPPA